MTESQDVQDELKRGLDTYQIPTYMYKALREYVNDHKAPGHFIQAIIMNNLSDAVAHADEKNLFVLRAWVGIFHNFAPSLCHGSEEKYKEWIKNGEAE